MTSPLNRLRAAKRSLGGGLPAPPVKARHVEWSAVSSADDLYDRPNEGLVELLLSAAQRAKEIRLDDLAARCSTPQEATWVNLWPGEHYRLLAALAEITAARTIIEVGTFQGPGALALAAGAPPGARVVTYDVVPWREVEGVILREEDFGSGLEQRIGNLAQDGFLRQELDTLRAGELLFVDGPKDGVFESAFCAKVLPLLEDRPRLVVFDDIRRLNMLQLWRDLPYPKLDATSLGHWSGTGMLLTVGR